MGDMILKKIFNLLKKFIMAVLFIYAYNKIAMPSSLFIPMNVYTILLVTFCGIPSIIMLILFSLICI